MRRGSVDRIIGSLKCISLTRKEGEDLIDTVRSRMRVAGELPQLTIGSDMPPAVLRMLAAFAAAPAEVQDRVMAELVTGE